MYKAEHVDTEKALKRIEELRRIYYIECEQEKQKVAKFYSGVQKGLDIAEEIFLCSDYESDESEDTSSRADYISYCESKGRSEEAENEV